MPLITYKFADGHSEEIEVSDEVAAAFAQLPFHAGERKAALSKHIYGVAE